MPTPVWRLIIDDALPGEANMATDAAVLASRRAGGCAPTLRLYRWEVPTVTLGRFQKLDGVDLAACERRGFDVVRRPTGGRGVLHDDELTYSVVADLADGVPRGVVGSYQYLSAALAEAYRTLGVDAELTRRSRGPGGSAACYLHATQADLSLGAAKLSGSAQVWSGDTVLQHGSFVRSRDVEAESEVFMLGEAGRASLAASAVTLTDALGQPPSIAAITVAVTDAFERVLGIRLEPGSLSAEEREHAASMASGSAVFAADPKA
jgi:lipoate-protein ligase A